MPTLAEIRQQYPQYSDLDDGVLAEGLYHRFYSDMPREQFNQRLGLPPAQPEKPPPGALDTAIDVAKSAGIGLAQGAIGLATFPGNVEQLGRLGINTVAGFAGAEGPVVSPTPVLPNYSGVKQGIEQKFTGEFYQPKTTAGEYARTTGEFASMAVGGPAGWANRATRVAVPAVASETAGQLTEGTSLEPWARVGGALLGGQVANAGQRAITPLPTDPIRQQAVKALEGEGVTALTAGQKTGRRPLQWTESTLSDIPFAGKKANAMMQAQGEQFTRAALKRAGVDASRATPDVIDHAFTTLGNKFEQLATRNDMLQSKSFVGRLKRVHDEYRGVTAKTMRLPIVENTIEALTSPAILTNGRIPGQLYQNVRSNLSRAASQLKVSDPPSATAVGKIIDELDRAMEFSIRVHNRADLGAFQIARSQFRNLLAVEDAVSRAGEAAATGIITPSALRSAVKKQGKRTYVRGKGDLGPLARAGETVMKPLPQSGTTPRAVAAGFVGGAALTDPTMIASVLAPMASGRVLMSGPVQRYLSNQATGSLPPLPQGDWRLRAAQSLMYPAEEQ